LFTGLFTFLPLVIISFYVQKETENRRSCIGKKKSFSRNPL
jgi:hypothetical protein